MTRHNIGCRTVTFSKSKVKYWKEQKIKNETAPSPHSKFLLHIETISKTEGLKAVLYQVQNGVKRVIAYASRSINKTDELLST